MRKIILTLFSVLAFAFLYGQGALKQNNRSETPNQGEIDVDWEGFRPGLSMQNMEANHYTGVRLFTDAGNQGGMLLMNSANDFFGGSVDNGDLYIWNTGSNPIVFAAGDDEIMRVQADGNVGIGTETPNERLEVVGNAKITEGNLSVEYSTDTDVARFKGNSNTAYIEFENPNWQDWTIGSDDIGDFTLSTGLASAFGEQYHFWSSYFRPATDDTKDLGSASLRWKTIYASNGTINTSDRRAKTNITASSYGLSAIMKLEPVSFDWKNGKNGSKKKLGLIAQDVEMVIPEVVEAGHSGYKRTNGHIEGASDRYGLYYSDLIPVLIKGMQEQQAQIEDLKQELTELKGK